MDQFSTQVLLGVVANLKRLQNGLLARFFSTVDAQTTEHIAFDIDEGKRYMAPFVSPLVPGRVKQMRGQRVATFTPAYIKQKARFDPERALRRAAGESFGTPLTTQERADAALAAELQDQIDYIDRRLEWMAVQALVSGEVTVTGENYPETVVDFGRHSDLVGITSSKWDAGTPKPADDLENWSLLAAKHSGSTTADIVFDLYSWQKFRENASIQKRLEAPKYDAGSIRTMELQNEGLVFRGQLDGFRLWTYISWYTTDQGVETPMLPEGTVLGIGAIDGVQAFGAIRDLRAGLAAVPVFPKSWEEEDPSCRWIMSQSAPLVVPRRVNASWSANVKT